MAQGLHPHTNRLAKEKSPYLLQHAHNPVDWFPWSEDAFSKARQEQKPIFLSIGYSTCHWCHVMERESFEDEEVAERLNAGFVSIKVDREERPDIDQIYMSVCQAMTGQGGWPLTIIMTPDQKPFFAATYLPKTKRFGRLGIMEVLEAISDKWQNERDKVLEATQEIASHMKSRFDGAESGEIERDVLERAYKTYVHQFDAEFGGFGAAPKFPSPHNLIFLLRYGYVTRTDHAIRMAVQTLEAMRRGGIFDHIGFGFSRYSVDEQWLVPHFEKMLYDNALLMLAYTEAAQLTGQAHLAKVVEEIAAYVLRDMRDATGGFHSAEDADSEGEEGRFYLWSPSEVIELLGEEKGVRLCHYFDITTEGNFEGSSIPNLIGQDLEAFLADEGLSEAAWEQELNESREVLFRVRERRIRPHRDDKILTSWNALLLGALARAGRVCQRREWVDAALASHQFIREHLIDANGRLWARYRDGEAAHKGYVDDYVFYAWALLELYEATWDTAHLEAAVQWMREAVRLFWDDKSGGFFFYGEDAEALIARPKELYDGAIPSGNSVAAHVLLRLADYTGDPEFAKLADAQLRAFAGTVARYPSGYAFFLTAVLYALGPSKQLVVVGDAAKPATRRVLERLQGSYQPVAVTLFIPAAGSQRQRVEAIAGLAQGKGPQGDDVTLYACENFTCHEPVRGEEAILSLLSSTPTSERGPQ